MGGLGAFWRTTALAARRRIDPAGLVMKRIKLSSTRRSNAKKRLLRLWQNEAVLRACAERPASQASLKNAPVVGEEGQQ